MLISFDVDGYTEARLQWQNDWRIDTLRSLQWGLEYRHIDVPDILTSSNYDLNDLYSYKPTIRYYGQQTATRLFQAESQRDIGGFYLQYQQHFNEYLELNVGARYDQFSSIGSRTSPRLGLLLHSSEHHTFKLLYGEAFRLPAENELNIIPNLSLSGNPDLKPEVTRTVEMIWLGQWETLSLSMGYFESRFDNAIVLVPTGNFAEFQYRNARQDPVKGMELESTVEVTDHLWLRAALTHFTTQPDQAFRETDTIGSVSLTKQPPAKAGGFD